MFENGPSKICGRQILKNLKEYGVLKIHITISNTETSSTRRNIYSPVDLFVLPSKSYLCDLVLLLIVKPLSLLR